MSLRFEIGVRVNVLGFPHKYKSHVMPAISAWWELFAVHASYFVLCVVVWIMHNSINSRVRYFFSGLKLISSRCHDVLRSQGGSGIIRLRAKCTIFCAYNGANVN